MIASFIYISQSEVCRTVSKRWAEQYPPDLHPDGPAHWQKKQETLSKLEALHERDLIPETINEVIGNESWTTLQCDTCQKAVEHAVIIGGPYDSMTVCAVCLNKAHQAMAKIHFLQGHQIVFPTALPQAEEG